MAKVLVIFLIIGSAALVCADELDDCQCVAGFKPLKTDERNACVDEDDRSRDYPCFLPELPECKCAPYQLKNGTSVKSIGSIPDEKKIVVCSFKEPGQKRIVWQCENKIDVASYNKEAEEFQKLKKQPSKYFFDLGNLLG